MSTASDHAKHGHLDGIRRSKYVVRGRYNGCESTADGRPNRV